MSFVGRAVRVFPLIFLFLATAAFPEPVEGVFEDEITVTATGQEENPSTIPAAVTVITREEIDDAQTESVAEVLRRVPGVNVAQSGSAGGVTSVFIRGTESDHTLVLYDGVRLNSPYFAGFDWSQASTSGLERVEVARGPYSALWGADAVGGVINMIPRRGLDGIGGNLFVEGGSREWRRAQAAVDYGSGRFDLSASGVYRQGTEELANSDFEHRELLLDTGWSWGDDSRVAVLMQATDSESGIPLSGATLTPNRRQTSEQTLLAVPLRWQLSNVWSLEATASRVDRDFSFSDPDDPFGFTVSRTAADTTQARLTSHHGLADHRLSLGAEWRRDEVADESSYGVNLDGETTEISSLFVQDLWLLSEKVRLIAGARWDDTERWGDKISPRLNIGWQALDTLELRAGYGEAFRQPSVGELYFPFSGNPDLEAETSRSLELGATWQPRNNRSRWYFNLYATALDDLIDFDYATYSFANVDSAEISGAELGFDIVIAGDLVSSLRLDYLDSEGSDGQPLLRRPEWSAGYTLAGAVWRTLRGDLSLLWVGERDDVDPISFERRSNDAFFTVNVSLAWQAWSHGELTLRAMNLADADYQEVLGYPSPGRRVIAGMRLGL